jgi:hypothetical protein
MKISVKRYGEGEGGSYPAYCTYIPEGLNEEYEKEIIKKLEEWGNNLEKTLYVGPWDIGDTSVIKLMREIGLKKRPVIILSDKDIKQLKKDFFMTLSTLLDLIWIEEYKKAAKEAIKIQKITKIKSLSKPIGVILSKVKIRFIDKGALMTVEPST